MQLSIVVTVVKKQKIHVAYGKAKEEDMVCSLVKPAIWIEDTSYFLWQER